MTEWDKLREKIAKRLAYQTLDGLGNEEATWQWVIDNGFEQEYLDKADQILAFIKKAGYKSPEELKGYVKQIGGIREIPRGGGADFAAYIADGVGVSWDRSTPIFKAFMDANYVQVEKQSFGK